PDFFAASRRFRAAVRRGSIGVVPTLPRRFRFRRSTMLCAFTLAFCSVWAGPANAAPAKDDQPKSGEYRVKVEVVLEPDGDYAVYRVQVWTHGKQQVLFCIDDGQIAVEGDTRLELEGGRLHRTDFVVIVSLRDGTDGNKKRQLEQVIASGGGGHFVLGDKVDADAKLRDISQIKLVTTTVKLGADVPIGRLFGQNLEIHAREPREGRGRP